MQDIFISEAALRVFYNQNSWSHFINTGSRFWEKAKLRNLSIVVVGTREAEHKAQDFAVMRLAVVASEPSSFIKSTEIMLGLGSQALVRAVYASDIAINNLNTIGDIAEDMVAAFVPVSKSWIKI